MSAIRLARGFTRRDRIIKFAGCYHGHSDGLLASAGSGLATLGIPSSPGRPDGHDRRHRRARRTTTSMRPRPRSSATARGWRRSSSSRWPGTWASSRQRPAFSRRCAALCDVSGALLIFDEVITGFRVARGGAQERYGVLPDLTILGKIVGGGLPAAAFGGRADVMEKLAPAGDVYQAGTLSGNPLATAAGISVLRRLREPAVLRGAGAEGSAARGRRSRPFGRVQRVGAMATLFLADRAGPELRGREGERRRALRRSVPPPARARDLRRAVAVRVPVRLARALRRGHRPHGRGSWRLLRQLTCSTRSPPRRRPRARSGGAAARPSRSARASSGRSRRTASRSGSRRSTRAISSTTAGRASSRPRRETWRCSSATISTRTGSCGSRPRATLDAVATLAELISTCAHLRAEQAEGDGDAWVDAVRRLGGDPDARWDRARSRDSRGAVG